MTTALHDGHALIRERYRNPDAAGPERLTETIAGQLSHRSVRAFTDEDVTPSDLDTIVAAAQSAPTSSNLQTWSVVAVRSQERRDRLSHLAGEQEFIRQAPLLLVWVADLHRAHALAARAGRPSAGTQHLESSLVAVIDATLAAQNAVVAAESLGLGTVFVGAVRNQPEAIAEELKLPAHAFAVVGLALGHPDAQRPARVKPRLPQQAVLHEETYDDTGLHEHVDAYEERIAEFYLEEGLAQSWLGRVLTRFESVDSLRGRERLRQAWETLGLSAS